MSAHRYRVIAHHQNKSMSVHPSNGDSVSKKEGQRLASDLLSGKVFDNPREVIKAFVVEEVLSLNP